MKKLLPVMLTFWFSISLAQNNVYFNGTVSNEQGEPLEGVSVHVLETKNFTITNSNGKYSIPAPKVQVRISYFLTGYRELTISLGFQNGESLTKDVVLERNVLSLDEVIIQSGINGTGNIRDISPRVPKNIPAVSGNYESTLKILPGVSPNNELSSQYSVRGGNFDENLIYVNDVEIYRPLQLHSGQQEGLSFINPDMVSRSSFSAGGFQARYGDKLSSVLDVRYARPDSSETFLSAGLNGLSATVKALSKDKKAYFVLGIRDKINRNILKTQDIKGSYTSNFYDFQLLAQRDVSPKLSLSFLGNYNTSKFGLIPGNRDTKFGTIDKSLHFNVNYSGQEADDYKTFMGAFTLLYKYSEKFNLKWISSTFHITEKEKFDTNGNYVLELPDASSGGVNPGFSIGSNENFADNKLNSRVYSTEVRGFFQARRSYFELGAGLQRDETTDILKEFSSSKFKIATNRDTTIFNNIANADNKVNINRFMGFIENTFDLLPKFKLYAGIRVNYNSYSKEVLISPRIGLSFRPKYVDNLSLRVSAGIYDQAPFYRELRNLDGTLNPDRKAQRSIQFLAAADYNFKNSPLKFTSELYYKKLDKLIPYKIEDLKIRYIGNQLSKGYATGIDLNLNGEFVNGMESFFRLSLMQSKEDIAGDLYIAKDQTLVHPGYLRRPTDQRVNFSIFFQDRLQDNPSYKVHVNLLYGSPLITGPPQAERYADIFKIPSYKRIDIGFSKDFIDPERSNKSIFFHRYFSSINAYAEIFNVLNINNTVSYLWIRDGRNNQYAVPNYLTSRQLNFRIVANINNK